MLRLFVGVLALAPAWSLARPSAPVGPLLGAEVRDVAASEAEWAALVKATAALPSGFKAGSTSFTFSPVELPSSTATMKMGVLALDEPTDCVAGVFTKNLLRGAPVDVGRSVISEERPRVSAILVNNKISNVRPGPGLGAPCALACCAAAEAALGLEGRAIPASTGVIGWSLPVDAMVAACGDLPAALTDTDAYAVATAMMTTDRYAKAARAELPGGGSIVGLVKGAGMIEPNLATMLCFLLTDADIDRADAQAALARTAAATLGSCGVDGDESTSDTVLLVSSRAGPPVDAAAFEAGLGDVLAQLAHHVVRNGEGTNHVIRATIRGDADVDAATALGRALVNGPLLKCAIAGDDPNVGRVVARVGSLLGKRGDVRPLDDASPLVVKLGGETIFEAGAFALDAAKEVRLSAHLAAARLGADDPDAPKCPPHGRCVEIDVDLGGDANIVAVVLGSDLTHEYVAENADYRS